MQNACTSQDIGSRQLKKKNQETGQATEGLGIAKRESKRVHKARG